MNARRVLIAASLPCADPLDLGQFVRTLDEAGVDVLHFEFRDWHFAQRCLHLISAASAG